MDNPLITLAPSQDGCQNLKEEIDALNEHAWQIYANQADITFDLGQKTYHLSTTGIFEQSHYTKGVIHSLLATSIANHVFNGDHNLGLQQAIQAIGLAEEIQDKTALGRAYFIIGFIHSHIGNYPESIEYTILQLNLAEAVDNKQGIASAKMSLGLSYAELGQYDKSLSFLEESLAIYQSDKTLIPIAATCLNNIAFVQMLAGDYEKSIQTAMAALEIMPLRDHIHIILLTKLGICYLRLGEEDKAEQYLIQAETAVRNNPNSYFHIRVHQRISQLYLHQQKTALAEAHLQKALDLAVKSGQKQMQYESAELLAECYKRQGRWQEALVTYESFHKLKEEVVSDRIQRQIKALEIMHQTETAVKEAEIYRLKTISLEEMVDKRTQELAKQSFQLEHLLEREQHLAHELQLTLAREAEMSQTRARIIEVVSHEFRTPLTIINTSSDLLKKNYNRLTDEKRMVYFKRIHDAIFNLTGLLQDVTFINRTDRDSLRPSYQTLSFQNLCLRLENTLRLAIDNRPQVFFSFNDDQSSVSTDLDLLNQMLTILLANAARYSEEGSPINITMALHSERMQFSVVDQGIGIPKEEQQKIFQLFHRGSNVGTRRGLGVGLSIVKRICDVLGGEVSVSSQGINQGATFSFSLPCSLK